MSKNLIFLDQRNITVLNKTQWIFQNARLCMLLYLYTLIIRLLLLQLMLGKLIVYRVISLDTIITLITPSIHHWVLFRVTSNGRIKECRH
jgi:hypothetical protein